MLLVPFRTDRPRLRPAYLTALLIAVNVLVYLGWAVQSWCIPASASSGSYPEAIASFGLWGTHLQPLAFVTHLFIHTDPLHLAGNMLFLWIFGSLIEDVIRPWGLAALYLGGGIVAAWVHLSLSTAVGYSANVPLVGASGSIAAIMGLFMVRFFRTRVELFCWFGWMRRRMWVQSAWALMYWLGLETIGGLLDAFTASGDGISHWAHLGGFAAGAAIAPLLGSLAAARSEYITDDPVANLRAVGQAERIAEAEKALKASPNDVRLLYWLAQAYRQSGQDRQATAAYRRCLKRHAEHGRLKRAAEVYLELVQTGEAVDLSPELLFQIAEFIEAEHACEAAQIYRALATRYPLRSEAQESLQRLSDLCLQRLNRPDEARRCLEELMRRYPDCEHAAEVRQKLQRAEG
jgi:membrane associated rhomboid family serine protease/TolA-binding protein